ncbi:hypothetical protein ACQPW1_10045 [Nocardia sp. CA-128927]|uniref:hypothetical protein n=1 Tax=Nocardia sp. CA-128927 TaxID=3239975 RepID=UPI003D95A352
MSELISHVCVLDAEGRTFWFAPGDPVPDWAATLITNPGAWAGPAPAPADTAGAGEAATVEAQAPAAPKRRTRKPAGEGA